MRCHDGPGAQSVIDGGCIIIPCNNSPFKYLAASQRQADLPLGTGFGYLNAGQLIDLRCPDNVTVNICFGDSCDQAQIFPAQGQVNKRGLETGRFLVLLVEVAQALNSDLMPGNFDLAFRFTEPIYSVVLTFV